MGFLMFSPSLPAPSPGRPRVLLPAFTQTIAYPCRPEVTVFRPSSVFGVLSIFLYRIKGANKPDLTLPQELEPMLDDMSGLRLRLTVVLVFSMILAFSLLFVGVYASLHADMSSLASQQVSAGEQALQASFASRSDVIRSAVLQAAAQQQLEDAIARKDADALHRLTADLALSTGLSFVVVIDPAGNILAGNRSGPGASPLDAAAANASSGTMISGIALLPAREMSVLTGRSSGDPALAVVTASPVNVSGRTIGVLYGGEFIDAGTRSVADVGRLTAGVAAIVLNGQFAATSLMGSDGAPMIGLQVPDAPAGRVASSGRETLHGVDYFASTTPLTDYNGNVVAAYWFGVPYARFEALTNHTLSIVAFWALIGIVIAVAFGVYVADRLGAAIAKRSRQVNDSAQELRVLVVGGEVSGDHVEQTQEKLERIETMMGSLDSGNQSDVGRLRELASEAVGDVVVINTLTKELSTRLRDAGSRVEQLGEVARALDLLVAGTRASRN
jgi:Arc/MetJ-type ribon-helix-helix transcriptional regulator